MFKEGSASVLFIAVFFLSVYARISFHLPYKDITAEDGTINAVLEGAGLYGEPGQPALPFYTCTFLLPPDADLNDVSVGIEGLKEEVLPGRYNVKPALPYYTQGKLLWPQNRNIVDGKDISVYSANAFFPEKHIGAIQTGQLREYKIIEVTVVPFLYNTFTAQLKRITSGELVINTAKLPNTATHTSYIPFQIRKLAEEVTLNYQEIASLYHGEDLTGTTQNRSKYVIITSTSLASGSTKLDGFIASKERRGFDVQVVTEADWGGGTGNQAADNIRSWLKSNYQSLGIEYAMMIGDPSGTVAMKRTYPDSKYEPLSDFFFADLSGNWDLDGDGRSGEYSGDFASGGADKYAEIHVGRIPVYGSNISELDNILDKITRYESDDISAINWRYKAFLPEDPFDGYQNGFYYGEAIKNNILVPNGWEYFRVYEDHYGVGAEKYPCIYANVLDSWKSDNWGVVIWQAHGLVTLAQDVMNTSNAAQLDDIHPSHVFQTSCHNGCPDASNNLAYAILKNTAVSTIASAVEILYSLNTTYGNGGAGNDFGYIYAKCLVQDSLPAAAAFDKTRSTLLLNSGLDWTNCVELNLYGCPAVGVYTCSDGTDINDYNKIHNTSESISFKANTCPSGTKILFTLNSPHHKGGCLDIYDIQGNTLSRITVDADSKTVPSWNLRNIAKGVYLAVLRLKQSNGTKVLVKEKLVIM